MGYAGGWNEDGMWCQSHRDTINQEDIGMNIYGANFAYTTTEDDLRRLLGLGERRNKKPG
jgi:hypothetical protein